MLDWLAVHDIVIDQYVAAWREVQVDRQATADAEAESPRALGTRLPDQ